MACFCEHNEELLKDSARKGSLVHELRVATLLGHADDVVSYVREDSHLTMTWGMWDWVCHVELLGEQRHGQFIHQRVVQSSGMGLQGNYLTTRLAR